MKIKTETGAIIEVNDELGEELLDFNQGYEKATEKKPTAKTNKKED